MYCLFALSLWVRTFTCIEIDKIANDHSMNHCILRNKLCTIVESVCLFVQKWHRARDRFDRKNMKIKKENWPTIQRKLMFSLLK